MSHDPVKRVPASSPLLHEIKSLTLTFERPLKVGLKNAIFIQRKLFRDEREIKTAEAVCRIEVHATGSLKPFLEFKLEGEARLISDRSRLMKDGRGNTAGVSLSFLLEDGNVLALDCADHMNSGEKEYSGDPYSRTVYQGDLRSLGVPTLEDFKSEVIGDLAKVIVSP